MKVKQKVGVGETYKTRDDKVSQLDRLTKSDDATSLEIVGGYRNTITTRMSAGKDR